MGLKSASAHPRKGGDLIRSVLEVQQPHRSKALRTNSQCQCTSVRTSQRLRIVLNPAVLSGLHRITFCRDSPETEKYWRTAGRIGRRDLTRILIADNHEVVRLGLRQILEAQPSWRVVAEAANGKEAVAKAIETAPDIAVIDYALPILSGVEVTRQIRRILPGTEVLIFTMHDNEVLVGELLRAGARGYLLKSDANRHLVAAIEALASHAPFFTANVSEALLRSFTTPARGEELLLTSRERQIVQLVAEGYSNKAMAALLGISQKTVETHRATAMRKLKLSCTAALVRYAVRNKVVAEL